MHPPNRCGWTEMDRTHLFAHVRNAAITIYVWVPIERVLAKEYLIFCVIPEEQGYHSG